MPQGGVFPVLQGFGGFLRVENPVGFSEALLGRPILAPAARHCIAQSLSAATFAVLLPDRCRALLSGDVQVDEDGTIESRTPAMRRLVRVLGLDDPEYTEFRLLWLGIAALAERRNPDLYRRLTRFPLTLPNLNGICYRPGERCRNGCGRAPLRLL